MALPWNNENGIGESLIEEEEESITTSFLSMLIFATYFTLILAMIHFFKNDFMDKILLYD